jgi:hypothetical protein
LLQSVLFSSSISLSHSVLSSSAVISLFSADDWELLIWFAISSESKPELPFDFVTSDVILWLSVYKRE